MIGPKSTAQRAAAKRAVKFTLSGFVVLALQAQIVRLLPDPAVRIDLFIPFMFVVAAEWSPLAGVLWAGSLGFIMDVFSGEFWGLHVGSYILTVCLVNMASDNFDCLNPAYQMGLVGLCALTQSFALGLFLSYVPMDTVTLRSIWVSLGIRTIVSALIAPFLIYPLLSRQRVGG